jgi:hypothetical protein
MDTFSKLSGTEIALAVVTNNKLSVGVWLTCGAEEDNETKIHKLP